MVNPYPHTYAHTARSPENIHILNALGISITSLNEAARDAKEIRRRKRYGFYEYIGEEGETHGTHEAEA